MESGTGSITGNYFQPLRFFCRFFLHIIAYISLALWDDDNDGTSNSTERSTLFTLSGLNHGLLYYDDYLYASSSTTVYRWPYTLGQRYGLSSMQTVVQGIPSGGHSSRSLVMDDLHRLYVQVGSGSNVDSTAIRSGIFRFNISDWDAQSPFSLYDDGEIFALGMRNEVGKSKKKIGGKNDRYRIEN